MTNSALNVVCWYAKEDDAGFDLLGKHLSVLELEGLIHIWHPAHTLGGGEYGKEAKNRFREADIVLFLLSADLVVSEAYESLVKPSLERRKAGKVEVLPVLLRPVDWQNLALDRLQPSPRGCDAISLWENKDEACKKVTRDLRGLVERIRKSNTEKRQPDAGFERSVLDSKLRLAGLAEDLKKGDLALYLGASVPEAYGVAGDETLFSKLAETAGIDDVEFDGSLSMLGEYYDIKPGYGRPKLVRRINDFLSPSQRASLYEALAGIRVPLLLITTAWDRQIEDTFRASGKKFVTISRRVYGREKLDTRLLLEWSDIKGSHILPPDDNLSNSDIFEDGYSLIYRLRGSLYSDINQTLKYDNALVFSESNYFTLAAHWRKVIPEYIKNYYASRGVLFLGCAPRRWEDRLLVDVVLDRTNRARKIALRRTGDSFEHAYWSRRSVDIYRLGLDDFVECLQELG